MNGLSEMTKWIKIIPNNPQTQLEAIRELQKLPPTFPSEKLKGSHHAPDNAQIQSQAGELGRRPLRK